MANISIVGTGSFGTSLAILLNDNKHNVKMYGKTKATVDEINNKHTNEKYLKNIVLDEKIKATTSLKEVLDFADYIVLAVPTKAVRNVSKEINNLLNQPKVFINVSKGLEPKTYKRVSEIVLSEIDSKYFRGFVALTGPSHAEEVAIKMLTVVLSVSTDHEIAVEVQELFNNQKYFRVYTSGDIVGAEVCGAIKNVIAVASGCIDGLGYGDNTKAALISRGLYEMKKIVNIFGGDIKTVNGLSGIGDLIVTANSHHSRNWNVGYRLGKGEKIEDILSSMQMVAEGVKTCEAVVSLAEDKKVELPISQAVYDVIFNDVNPKNAIIGLMEREMKDE